MRIDPGPPKWGKTTCTHCNAPYWNSGEDAAGRCKPCVKNPDRVKRCSICFENELAHKWDSHGCGSDVSICKSCAMRHVKMAIDEGATIVKCPCCPRRQVALSDDDLKKLDPRIFSWLQRNRAEAASTWLVDLFEREPEMLAWATSGTVQICPHCSSLVERSSGCNHMTCKCGGDFCYQCGRAGHSCRCARGTPTLPVDFKALIERRKQRRLTFLMGSHCEESVVYKLPPDLLRRIVDAA